MIVASVLPYYRAEGGARCVVVITDTTRPGAPPLATDEIPVGYLGDVDGKVTRIVGAPEIAAVVARVVALARGHAVEAVYVEHPPGDGVEAQRGRDIGAALALALPRVLPISGAQCRAEDLTARLAVVLPRMEDEGRDDRIRVTAPPLLRAEHAPDSLSRVVAQGIPTPAPPPAQPPPKAGRRVAGIDPGSRHVAVTVLEALGVEGGSSDEKVAAGTDKRVDDGVLSARVHGIHDQHVDAHRGEPQNERAQVVHAPHSTTLARVVASLSLTLGRDVPLRTPKTITRKDDSTYIKTHRHEVTDADVVQLLTDVAIFLAPLDVDEVRVETATHAHEGPDGPRRGATAFLLRSNRYGGVIEGALLAKGLPVKSTTSRTWRAVVKRLAGAMSPGKGASDGTEHQGRAPDLGVASVGDESRIAVDQGSGQVRVGGVDLAQRDHGRGHDRDGGEVRGGASGGALHMPTGAGSALPGPSSALTWRSAVRALVTGLPDGEHILDAAGCALPAFAPTPEEKPAPTTKGTRKASGGGSRRARQDEERAAMGCLGDVCRARGRRGHDPACPVAVARAAKVAQRLTGKHPVKGPQTCRKCGQPRKGHVCPAKEGASG